MTEDKKSVEERYTRPMLYHVLLGRDGSVRCVPSEGPLHARVEAVYPSKWLDQDVVPLRAYTLVAVTPNARYYEEADD
jgi:hypothetical protein